METGYMSFANRLCGDISVGMFVCPNFVVSLKCKGAK